MPELNAQFAYGVPASTPALDAMWAAWHTITQPAHPWLDQLTTKRLQALQTLHTQMITLADLFRDAPAQWGLRGDPYLWREMQATLGDQAYPETENQLAALLAQTYARLTGMPLENQAPIYVERYSHGGISSGYVSPQFWAETAFPLLRARYRQAREA